MKFFKKLLCILILFSLCQLPFHTGIAEEFAPPTRYEELLEYFPKNFLVHKVSDSLPKEQVETILKIIPKFINNNDLVLSFKGIPKNKPILSLCLDDGSVTSNQYYFVPTICIQYSIPDEKEPVKLTYHGLWDIRKNVWILSDTDEFDQIAASNGFFNDSSIKRFPSSEWAGQKGFDVYLVHDKAMLEAKQPAEIRKDLYLLASMTVWKENLRDLSIPDQFILLPYNPPQAKNFEDLKGYLSAHYKVKKMSGYTFTGDDKENLKKSYELEINHYNEVTRIQNHEDMLDLGIDDELDEPFVPDWSTLTIKNVGDIYEINSDKNIRYYFFRNIDLKVYSSGKKGSFRTNLHRIRFQKGKWVGISSFLSFSDKKTISGIPFGNVMDPMNSYNIYYSYSACGKIRGDPMPDPEFLTFIRSLIIQYPFADRIYN